MTTQSEIFDKKVKRDASNMNQTVRTPEIMIIYKGYNHKKDITSRE